MPTIQCPSMEMAEGQFSIQLFPCQYMSNSIILGSEARILCDLPRQIALQLGGTELSQQHHYS